MRMQQESWAKDGFHWLGCTQRSAGTTIREILSSDLYCFTKMCGMTRNRRIRAAREVSRQDRLTLEALQPARVTVRVWNNMDVNHAWLLLLAQHSYGQEQTQLKETPHPFGGVFWREQ